MGLQPRRRPPAPKVEPVSGTATVVETSDEPVEATAPTVETPPQCRVVNDDGERCTKPLGHVGAGDVEHAYE